MEASETMTTTVSTSTSTTTAESVASALAAPGGERARPRRFGPWLAVVAPILMLIGGGAWAATSWTRRTNIAATADTYIVKPRTFSVVLKEKGELKAAKSTDIASQVEGRSTIIYLIPEGTAVKKGDLLVELASDQIEARIQQDELKETNAITNFESAKTELEIQRDRNASDIRKAELSIELRRLGLEKYEKGDWEQSLRDAQIEIERATIALERRTEDFAAAKQLRAKNFITKIKYDEDEFNFKKAQWELEKAIKSLHVLKTYTHVADLRQKQSDLEEAIKEAERVGKNADAEEMKRVRALEGKTKELELIQDLLAKLRTQKEQCRITAPAQGFVVYYAGGGGRHFMSGDNQIKEGATVHERQIMLSLPDTSKMMVVVRVHEAKTDKLHIGQQVVVKVEGLRDQQFTGTVTKIAVLADSQNRWLNPDLKEYETEITLDPSEAALKPGVTAHVEILVDLVENELAVPVQAIYAKGGKRYVFRREARKAAPVEVTLGAIGTEWASVTAGLTQGDSIMLAFDDELKRQVPDPPPEERGMSGFHNGPRRGGATSDRRGSGAPHGTSGSAQSRPPSGTHRPSGISRPDGEKRSGAMRPEGDSRQSDRRKAPSGRENSERRAGEKDRTDRRTQSGHAPAGTERKP